MNEPQIACCPCGKTPTDLIVTGEYERPKWARVSGNCCASWEIEFRNGYLDLSEDEAQRLARRAWNNAPRAEG